MPVIRTARGTSRPLHLQAGCALAGAIVASTALWSPAPFNALAMACLPAIYMIVTLLGGWLFAMASAAVLAACAWMLGGPATLDTGVVAALGIACAEALRRGVGPHYLCIALLLAGLLITTTPLGQQQFMPAPGALAEALVLCGANAALATFIFLLLPRRSARLPARSRARLEHVVFTAVVGAASWVALATLHIAKADPASPSPAALLNILGAVVLSALLASLLLSVLGARALQQLAAMSVDARRRPLRGAPLELVMAKVRTSRRWLGLQRSAESSRRELLRTGEIAHQSQRELARASEALRRRTGELKEAAIRGADTRARLEVLVDAIPTAALFTDVDGSIRHANLAARSLLDMKDARLEGQSVGVLIPDEFMLDHPLSTLEGKLTITAGIGNCHVRVQGGASREVAVQILPFTVGNSERRLVLLRKEDSTRRAMAALEQARNLTRSVSQSRDMFIATMSHEMRTPLHGLIATLDMMRTTGEGTEFQKQLGIARSSARALLKIANDVLDFTRIGSSQFTLDQRLFAMPGVLTEVMAEARAQATTLGLTLSSHAHSAMPPSFLGDPNRIKQILGNLVSNALKFTSQGGVKLEIAYDGSLCVIDVIDSGEGIPQDKRERIFEPFVQAHSTGRGQVGTGLGLPICRRLAKAMGGDLVLLWSGQNGSAFRLTLPLQASQEQPPEDQSQRVFRNPRGRILVVEDNPANRYVAQALLTGLECPATIVESGAEALERLSKEEFDLILMDCQMPGIDGYETTRRARRLLKRRVPIIAMTANAMTADRKNSADAGMDDFLAKPFDRKALNDILCKWLSKSAPLAGNATDAGGKQGLLPDLDSAVLDELWESLQWRPEPLNQIRTTFGDSLKPIVALLRAAEHADRSTLLRHLHTLLGSSGMVGARQVEHIAGRLRHAINEGRFDVLRELADELEGAMRRYDSDFERWLANRRAQGRPGSRRMSRRPLAI